MIRPRIIDRIADTRPGDVVEVNERRLGAVVVRVEWKLGDHGDAMVRLYSETAGVCLSRGISQHLFIPYHVDVLRVIDPNAPVYMAPEQGETDGPTDG